jgi:hypothetical protein
MREDESPCLTPHTNTSSMWVRDLQVSTKSVQVLEGLEMYSEPFLNMMPKAHESK